MTLTNHPGLEAHNRYRAYHHAQPLNWSEALTMEAQKLAQQMVSHGGFVATRQETDTTLGQNLAKLTGNPQEFSSSVNYLPYLQPSPKLFLVFTQFQETQNIMDIAVMLVSKKTMKLLLLRVHQHGRREVV